MWPVRHEGQRLRLLLAGDVMTGRGVDQILPSPGDPTLLESYLKDARDYVGLAEEVSGPLPRPVPPEWPWGEALPLMRSLSADLATVRVMNLETSVTRSDDATPHKPVRYRMSPENVGCLALPGVDVWALANNHVLDYGTRGLRETLATLARAGLRVAGAGANLQEAWQPAVVVTEGRRLLVWSAAHASSGTPTSWAADATSPGVALLPDLSRATADRLLASVASRRRHGDLVVVSVHWGSNWGYDVPEEQVRFAHRLLDGGVDVVHGHSSHHPRPLEVYDGRLVLYGCGDLVNDYEGIAGEGARYRDDLRVLYVVDLSGPPPGATTGWSVRDVRLVVLQSRRLRLELAEAADVTWLADRLTSASQRFGVRLEVVDDAILAAAHR